MIYCEPEKTINQIRCSDITGPSNISNKFFMKKYLLALCLMIILFGYYKTIAQTQSLQNNSFMIRHSIIFKLKVAKNSQEEKDFFIAAKKLTAIPGVQKFECLKQSSKKNKFDFGIAMEFASQKLYDEYSNHPDHVQFIQQYWLKYVEDFLEIDYEPLTK
jgi:hypothetical protein